MKSVYLAQLAALASALNLMASTKITAPDGAVFFFGDWSPPTVLAVKSDEGETQVVNSTCDVTRTLRRTEPTLKVDLVFHPSTGEVWLGQKADRYAVCRRKIWGVTSRGARLLFRLSKSAGDAVNGQELVIQQYLARLIQDPETRDWYAEGGSKYADLYEVFGFATVCTTSAPMEPQAPISDVGVSKDGVVATLKSRAGRTLSLTVGANFRVLTASIDGSAIPVLFNGQSVSPQVREWWPPGEITALRSDQGSLEALRCGRNYTALNATGERVTAAIAKAIVLTKTGDLWIGPDLAQVIVLNGRLLGFLMSGDGSELLVSVGPRAQIPKTPEGSSVFAQALARWMNDFDANQRQFKPDARLNVANLFAGNPRFPNGLPMQVRSALIQNGRAVVTLTFDGPRPSYPQIELTSDLRVWSSRLLDSGEGY